MIDPTACPTWGAEIRSIVITCGIVLACLLVLLAGLSIGWARGVSKHMDAPDPDDSAPARRTLLRGRLRRVERPHA